MRLFGLAISAERFFCPVSLILSFDTSRQEFQRGDKKAYGGRTKRNQGKSFMPWTGLNSRSAAIPSVHHSGGAMGSSWFNSALRGVGREKEDRRRLKRLSSKPRRVETIPSYKRSQQMEKEKNVEDRG